MNPRPSGRHLLALALFASVVAVSGCAGPLSGPAVTSELEAGCALEGVLDPNGNTVASICKSVAPVVGPVIADVINSLGSKPAADGAEAVAKFVPLKKGGKQIGYVRTDVAAAVQAKVDAS